jgi:hypothetical protein
MLFFFRISEKKQHLDNYLQIDIHNMILINVTCHKFIFYHPNRPAYLSKGTIPFQIRERYRGILRQKGSVLISVKNDEGIKKYFI